MELNFSQVFNWTDYVRRFWCYKFSCFFFEFLSERHGSVGMTAHKKQDLTARLQGHISNPVITTCNFMTGVSYDLALQDQVMKICQLAWFNEICNNLLFALTFDSSSSCIIVYPWVSKDYPITYAFQFLKNLAIIYA